MCSISATSCSALDGSKTDARSVSESSKLPSKSQSESKAVVPSKPGSATQTSVTVPISKVSDTEKSSRTAKAKELLKQARLQRSMFEDAASITLYDQVLELTPDDDVVRMERAHQYAAEKQNDLCIAEYKRLTKSKNLDVAYAATADLGRLYRKMGKYKEAFALYSSMRRGKDDGNFLTALSDTAISAGDGNAALELSPQITKLIGSNAGRQHRARALSVLKRPQEALEEYDYLIAVQTKLASKVAAERRVGDPSLRWLVELLLERAKVYDSLNKPELAALDRKRVKDMHSEVYEEMPFRIKESTH